MRPHTFRVISAITLALIAIIAAAMAMALYGRTIVEWWKPACACLAAAFIIGFLLRGTFKWIIGWKSSASCTLIATAVFFVIFNGVFYTVNFYCSDSDSLTQLSVEVTDKYSEEHYRVKRVSRGRTTRGEKYMVYRAVIALPDGRTKVLDVPLDKYRNYRIGEKITLAVEDGALGAPVIKNLKFPVRKYQPAGRRH